MGQRRASSIRQPCTTLRAVDMDSSLSVIASFINKHLTTTGSAALHNLFHNWGLKSPTHKNKHVLLFQTFIDVSTSNQAAFS